CDEDYGWKQCVKEAVTISVVPGAHEKILEEPCAGVVAKELARLLETPRVSKGSTGKIELNNAPIPKRKDGETAPVSFQQQRIWLLNQLEPQNAVYNHIAAIRFKGKLNERAVQASLEELVRRHEVLRTVFPSA